MNKLPVASAGLVAAFMLLHFQARAWDYELHRFINQLALASLPTNFPSFARTPAAQERIAFLSGEPDRWRNTPDMDLRHYNHPDHFLDADELDRYGLTPEVLTPFRYEFVAQLAFGRATHATNFPPLNPSRDLDHTRALIGFLPWAMTEHYSKLKSAFSYLRALEDAGTPDEIENARQNAGYIMGVMGHFVGDATQPLHTTRHYNGWVGANPNKYTTDRTFHAWIDGGFLRATGVKTNAVLGKVRAARLPWTAAAGPQTNAFPELLCFVLEQAKLVEPLYQLEKEKKLTAGEPGAEEGREFLTGQLLRGGQMLGDLWYAAWQEAPRDTFLQAELARRKP
jgi:hypothetical protein